MDPGRGVDVGVALCDLQRALAARHVAAGDQDQADTGVRHGGKQFLPVAVKGLVVVMGMGVKIHGAFPLPVHRDHHIPARPLLQVRIRRAFQNARPPVLAKMILL